MLCPPNTQKHFVRFLTPKKGSRLSSDETMLRVPSCRGQFTMLGCPEFTAPHVVPAFSCLSAEEEHGEEHLSKTETRLLLPTGGALGGGWGPGKVHAADACGDQGYLWL